MLPRTVAMVVLVLAATVTGAITLADTSGPDAPETPDTDDPADDPTNDSTDELTREPLRLTTADSADAFQAYVARAQRETDGDRDRLDRRRPPESAATPTASADGGVSAALAGEGDASADAGGAAGAGGGGDGGAPTRRVGGTNVQVVGVDEPDVVKTVGDRFYVQRALPGRHDRAVEGAGTSVVAATPPADARVTASIDRSGRMLVGEERVVNGVLAFEFSDCRVTVTSDGRIEAKRL